MHRRGRWLALFTGLALLTLAAPVQASPAGTTLLASRPDGTGPFALPLDNHSEAPLATSSDGRYVAFTSPADGFGSGADPATTNVFLRDNVAGTTVLVSRSDGLNGASVNASVATLSAARISLAVEPGAQALDAPHNLPHVLVAFSTTATNLVDHTDHAVPPTGGREEVWLRDVTAGTTYLVSRSNGLSGAVADGPSSEPSLAVGEHGPLVAFTSASLNLNPHEPFGGPAAPNVYLRGVGQGSMQMISCPLRDCRATATSGGISLEPSLRFVEGSSDSQMCPISGTKCALVAFTTSDPTVGGDGTDSFKTQVVVSRVREFPSGQLAEVERWLTESVVSISAAPGDGSSDHPVLTPDGRGVAFLSKATDLDDLHEAPAGTPPGGWTKEAYFRPLASVFTFMVSLGPRAQPADEPVGDVSVGGNPYRVGFTTTAGNLGVPNGFAIQRAYQVQWGEQESKGALLLDRASGAGGVIGDDASSGATISPDGTAAVFVSRSDNLGAGGGTEFNRVYRRRIDPLANDFEALQLVSRPSGSEGSQSAEISKEAISADGRYVAFQSQADDLSSVDDDRYTNVFVRDTVADTTTLVSRATGASGAAADANSTLVGISEDGHRVAFNSGADNLGANGEEHAYVRDLTANTTTVVTRVNGPTGAIAPGIGLSISGDGNRVAFHAEGGFEPEANGAGRLYVRDLAAQTTIFVDRDDGATGHPATDDPAQAALNRDGTRIAWSTRGLLPVAGGDPNEPVQRVYLRDLNAHTTVLVSRGEGLKAPQANADSFAPSIDAKGDVVAFESDATNLGTPSAPRSIWIRHIATGHTELASRVSGAGGAAANDQSFGPSLDAAGDRVAFVTPATNLGAGPGLHGAEVYVRDLGAKTTEVVSRANGSSGAPANPGGFFRGVSLSASGGCVAFAGAGLNYGDGLASADFSAARERVLRDNCGAPSSGAAPDEPAPAVLGHVAVRPKRFYVGGADGGTQIAFTLDQPSTVALLFERPAKGHRAAASAAHKGHKHGMRRVGQLTVSGHAGANSVRFSGRIRRRALAPGRYRLTITPLGGVGRREWFAIVKRPR